MVQKQSGANTVEVVDAVRAKMAELEQQLPADIRVNEVLSSEEIITGSIRNLTSSIWYALVFVTLVVLMFLREWKSSFIVFITMPVSLISAFIAMYVMNYTINIFSLMSLVIAIEWWWITRSWYSKISRSISKGSRSQTGGYLWNFGDGHGYYCINGNNAGGISPLLLWGSRIMFKQLAILTVVCMTMSLFAALTLTPMLSSKLLKRAPRDKEEQRRSKLYTASEKIFNRIEDGYKRVLGWAVFHKGVTLPVALLVFVLTIWLAKR